MQPTSITVLVVEDEPLIRLATVDELECEGYTVLEASCADAAVSVIERHAEVSVIFTDIDMPGKMDGLKLAAFVRDKWPPIKIIVTSGRMFPVSTDLPFGVPFIAKPYAFDKLIGSIRQLLAD